MEKRTLKFPCIISLAKFSKLVSTGYLMNTNKFTLTGRFTPQEMDLAIQKFQAQEIETSDKVYTY